MASRGEGGGQAAAPVDYAGASAECDVIMKGGATSGLVYPKAVLRLARRYRFRSIGGASAGAVAAAITAAAEYGRSRPDAGFGKVEQIPDEMGRGLLKLFEPPEEARRIFRVVRLGGLEGRLVPALVAALVVAWPASAAGLALGLLLGLAAVALGGGWAAMVLGLILGLILAVLLGLAQFIVMVWRLLRTLDYGFCTGRSDRPGASPVSDWLAETIEVAAGTMAKGGPRPERPLTFGDLRANPHAEADTAARSIDLRIMTTNLSMRRPHVLPNLGDDNYYFRRDEFGRVLPDWVVDHMVGRSPAKHERDGVAYWQFPPADDLPVVAAARMSLSFPFIISAVPLYRFDFPHAGKEAAPARLLFSDGGISSNFPIHFFDAILPRRPTFGVALESYRDPIRPKEWDGRVRLPLAASDGQWIGIDEVRSPLGYLMAIINAAKDWQDMLQSTLPGYRERIVHVYLKDDEGGLNLEMDPDVIRKLVDFGDRAGALLGGESANGLDRDPFDFDDHRWRRFLVAFARLEETLCQTATRWHGDATTPSFATFAKGVIEKPPSYVGSTLAWRRAVFDRFDGLMGFVRDWCGEPLANAEGSHIPKPRTDMRITAKLDEPSD